MDMTYIALILEQQLYAIMLLHSNPLGFTPCYTHKHTYAKGPVNGEQAPLPFLTAGACRSPKP